MKKHSGMSLAEVLISLFLATLIITILIQFYLSSKNQYLKTEEILTTQLDVQWISDLLSDSIRRAGFTPCLGIDKLIVKDLRSTEQVIRGLVITNAPQQSIQVNRMSEYFAKVLSVQNGTRIIASSSGLFHPKNPLIIADCQHAEIHHSYKMTQNKSERIFNLNNQLHFNYTNSVYVGEFLGEKWIIKNNSQKNSSLFYKLKHLEELSPLIQSLNSHQQDGQVKVIMGLAGGKTHELLVAVRGS